MGFFRGLHVGLVNVVVGLMALLSAAGLARAAEEDEGTQGALTAEVARISAARTRLDERRMVLEAESVGDADEIARRKAEPAGIARDLRLGQLLATAQEHAWELERIAGALRAQGALLVEKRRALVAMCERGLAAPGISASERAALGQRRADAIAGLRAAQAPEAPLGVAAAAAPDPLAGPAELEERADRMGDDAAKLKREIERLGRRIEGTLSERRLREGADAVADDLFVESGAGRAARRTILPKAETSAFAAGGAASGAPRADTKGGVPGPLGSDAEPSVPSTMLRGVVDPATLGDLRRAEAGGDPELTLLALRRAQADLGARAGELSRREIELRRRAAVLRKPR